LLQALVGRVLLLLQERVGHQGRHLRELVALLAHLSPQRREFLLRAAIGGDHRRTRGRALADEESQGEQRASRHWTQQPSPPRASGRARSERRGKLSRARLLRGEHRKKLPTQSW
jgi:hypothetical protein